MELIDKNKAIKVLQDTPCGSAGIKARMVGRIEKLPTVDVFEQIRAEIDGIEINGQVDEHTMFIRTGEQVKQMALEIIGKYIESEDKE